MMLDILCHILCLPWTNKVRTSNFRKMCISRICLERLHITDQTSSPFSLLCVCINTWCRFIGRSLETDLCLEGSHSFPRAMKFYPDPISQFGRVTFVSVAFLHFTNEVKREGKGTFDGGWKIFARILWIVQKIPVKNILVWKLKIATGSVSKQKAHVLHIILLIIVGAWKLHVHLRKMKWRIEIFEF